MKREEEMIQEAIQRFGDSAVGKFAFCKGAQWADEHPKNPWRDAKKDPPKREIGNKIYYTFLDTAIDGVHTQRYYHFAEFKKYDFGEKGWLDEDGNLVLVEIADFWMPIPELLHDDMLINGLNEMNEYFKKGGES